MSLHELYPPQAVEFRVATHMPAPRFAVTPKVASATTASVRDVYGPRIAAEFRLGDSSVALVDKAFPHARFDLMLLAADQAVHSSAADLSPATTRFIFGAAAQFANFVSDPAVIDRHDLENGFLHVSYNFDRVTIDRENSMFFDKRFHLHLNYFPNRDLYPEGVQRWGDLKDPGLARRMIDPAVYLAEEVLLDRLAATECSLPALELDRDRDIELGLPPGLKIRLPRWQALSEAVVQDWFATFHTLAQSTYDALLVCFTGGADVPKPWTRRRLLPVDEIERNVAAVPWLRDPTRQRLLGLARVLRQVTESDVARFRADENARVRWMSLAGLDYSVSIASAQRNTRVNPATAHDDVYVIWQAKLFGDIGGAGLPPIDGLVAVMLDRASGPVLGDREVAERDRFRAGFIERLQERTRVSVAARGVSR